MRSGECPAGMTEEFAFEKVVGDGAAVDRDELVVDAGDCLCNQFLAYARFSLDEHGTRMHNRSFDGLAEVLHGGAFSDQVAHAFTENLTCVMNFLEFRDTRHQVELQGFHREDAVVKFVRNPTELFRVFGVNENQCVRRLFAEGGQHF